MNRAINYLSNEMKILNVDLRLGKKATSTDTVSYTHLRAHETGRNLVCRLLLEKKQRHKARQKSRMPSCA